MDLSGQQQVISALPSTVTGLNPPPHIFHDARLKAALEAISDPAIKPDGLKELESHCFNQYSHNPHRYQIVTKKRFLCDGSDPLDYIYIFKNEGDPSRSIPRHWHYVGFGLSDIYDYRYVTSVDLTLRSTPSLIPDNRKPLIPLYLEAPTEQANGFGFELTFRLKCNSNESWSQDPPEWPGLVMQDLAQYVYKSKEKFSVGHHLLWRCPLSKDKSYIEHILMALDPQLDHTDTSRGRVTFIQLVGVNQEELEAARDWSAKGVLEIMAEHEETGGPYLVTDMQRKRTIFDLNDNNKKIVDTGVKLGSDMTRIIAIHKTCATKPKWFIETDNIQNRDSGVGDDDDLSTDTSTNRLDSGSESEDEVSAPNGPFTERGNMNSMNRDDSHHVSRCNNNNNNSNPARAPSRMSYESVSALWNGLSANNLPTSLYDSMYILFDRDTAKIFLAVLSNILAPAHKRPFTIGNFEGGITTLTIFFPEGTKDESLISTSEKPYARNGFWLHIYIPDNLRKQILDSMKADFCRNEKKLSSPKNYSWPEYRFHITVVDEIKK